jgi:regulator of replication initiation timing
MSLEKVEGFASLRKDTSTGGVVNVDKQTFENYKLQKMIALQRTEETKVAVQSVSSLQSEINTLKSDLNDIKSILVKLLEKGK